MTNMDGEQPKYDPRFPPGLGSWRKPVAPKDEPSSPETRGEQSIVSPGSSTDPGLNLPPFRTGRRSAAL